MDAFVTFSAIGILCPFTKKNRPSQAVFKPCHPLRRNGMVNCQKCQNKSEVSILKATNREPVRPAAAAHTDTAASEAQAA